MQAFLSFLARFFIFGRTWHEAAYPAALVTSDLTHLCEVVLKTTASALKPRLGAGDRESFQARIIGLSHPFEVALSQDVGILLVQLAERPRQARGQ